MYRGQTLTSEVLISGVNMPNSSIQGGELTPVTDGSISQPDTPNVRTYLANDVTIKYKKYTHN